MKGTGVTGAFSGGDVPVEASVVYVSSDPRYHSASAVSSDKNVIGIALEVA